MRMRPATLRPLWVRAFIAAAFAALLAGCLLDHTLITPGNAYDPKVALSRERDSLADFDTVEILLMDPDDSTISIRLWKGPLPSIDGLPTHVAGDGQTLVYLVQGTRAGRDRCFTERVSRQGEATVLRDTCGKKDSAVPPGTGRHDSDSVAVPNPKPKPVPRIQSGTFDFGENDTFLTITIERIDSSEDSAFRLEPSLPSVHAPPGGFAASHDTALTLTLDRSGLAPGSYHGTLHLLSGGAILDSAAFSFSVRKPVAEVRGTLMDWRDSLPQEGVTVKLDDREPGLVSDGNGRFTFAGVDLGRHALAFSGAGRLGSVDSFTVAAEGLMDPTFSVSPKAAFAPANAGWLLSAGRTAVVAGYGLVLGSGLDQPGSILAYPLDNPKPSLQRFIPQGNSDGDPDFPEYFEAGDIAGDSTALFITYPEGSRLGRIGAWKTGPQTVSVPIGFEPGGLLLDGPRLLVLGRLPDSTMVLGEFKTGDLSLNRLDTLKGFTWDGALPSQRLPKLAAWKGAYFAVDGNSPNVKGRLLRIGGDTRKVEASRELSDPAINGLAIYDGMIYVTSMSSSGKQIRLFDPALSDAGTLAAGTNTDGIAFATEGRLSGYGFVTTDDNAVLVIRPQSGKPVGRFDLSTGHPGRSVSVDGRTGSVLVSDGDKLYLAQF